MHTEHFFLPRDKESFEGIGKENELPILHDSGMPSGIRAITLPHGEIRRFFRSTSKKHSSDFSPKEFLFWAHTSELNLDQSSVLHDYVVVSPDDLDSEVELI